MAKKITLQLDDDQAMALAQLTKRFTWEHAKSLSKSFTKYDGAAEVDVMLDGVMTLSRALADAGFAPR